MSGYSPTGYETHYDRVSDSQAENFDPVLEQAFAPLIPTDWFRAPGQSYTTTPSNASSNSLYFPQTSGNGSSTVKYYGKDLCSPPILTCLLGYLSVLHIDPSLLDKFDYTMESLILSTRYIADASL